MCSGPAAVRTSGRDGHVSCSRSIGPGRVCVWSTVDADPSGEGVGIRGETRKDTGGNVERWCLGVSQKMQSGSSSACKPVTVLSGGTKESRRF